MTPEFLDTLNTAIDEGVASYRNDRAANVGLSDAEFLHKFGAELVAMVRSEAASVEQVAYTAAAALHRLASLEGEPATKVVVDWGARGQPMRYIVLGTHADIEHWRREKKLPPRAVIAVTSSDDLRGYGPGVYMLVTLGSWKPTVGVRIGVREAIRIMEGAGAVIHR